MKKKILVIGSNGQLGNCIRKIEHNYKDQFEFIFTDRQELDIVEQNQVDFFLSKHKPNYCINASAYTAVDLAEKEKEKAFNVNAYGVRNLAKACNLTGTILVHISTDYVFDGNTVLPYNETDTAKPINVYGESKLLGEQYALENNKQTYIIRTSWLYSEFNKNFVKTMIQLFSSKTEIGIIADQYGQPTNANDLSELIFKIISNNYNNFGIYHFSNYPETTWYNFALKIAEYTNSKIIINKLTTSDYITEAIRPKRSTMNLAKVSENFNIYPKSWQKSLEVCVKILNEK